MMKRGPSLIDVMKGRNRGRPELVQAALLALQRLVSPRVESSHESRGRRSSPSLEDHFVFPANEN